MRTPVVIAGAGGHALVIWDVLDCNDYRVVGFSDPSIPAGSPKHLGSMSCPVLGDDRVLEEQVLADPDLKLFAGVGPEPMEMRRTVIATIDSFGPGRMLTAIHPRSVIAASARIGLDTVVMAGAIVNPGAEVGRHCVINTGATVDHECRIGNNVFVQPGSHLGGRVTVGDDAVVGIGASVREKTYIGRNAYVGGGAFVNRDVPDDAVVFGVPARFVRYRYSG